MLYTFLPTNYCVLISKWNSSCFVLFWQDAFQFANGILCILCTPIPPGEHRFSSEHRRKAWLGAISTGLGDCLGISHVVHIFTYKLLCINLKVEQHLFLSFAGKMCYILPMEYCRYCVRPYHQKGTGTRLNTGSKAWSGAISTGLGDCLRISHVVLIFTYALLCINRIVQ